LNLNLISQNIYSTLMCGLGIFAGPLYIIYHATSYLGLLPEYELSSSTRFGQFHKFGNIWVGSTALPATPKETISAWVRVFVDSYLRVRFDFSSTINFRDMNGSPNRGPKTLLGVIPVGPKWYKLILRVWCNCTRGHILHRFRDIAVDMSNIAILGYNPLAFNPRRRGSPGTIYVKFCMVGSGWHCGISTNWTNVTDIQRQTDLRRHISERNVVTFG